MGDVDKGTTDTDFDPEEQQRGITIYAACVHVSAGRTCTVNLIDTPGHVDFTAEVERSLRVLDGGVVVFSAREGVEAQSETVWRQADKYHVPRLAFINKMDREGADFDGTSTKSASGSEANPVAIQIPVGAGPAARANPFRGVIDLVEMKLLTFRPGEARAQKSSPSEIPTTCATRPSCGASEMLEQLYDYSQRADRAGCWPKRPMPGRLVRKVLREATLASA